MCSIYAYDLFNRIQRVFNQPEFDFCPFFEASRKEGAFLVQ
jgi:hypothetical protein